jgi:hypothetical protein
VQPQLWQLGAPPWKLETSTIYELVETGVDVGFDVFILTTDAAIPGSEWLIERVAAPSSVAKGSGFHSSQLPSRTTCSWQREVAWTIRCGRSFRLSRASLSRRGTIAPVRDFIANSISRLARYT